MQLLSDKNYKKEKIMTPEEFKNFRLENEWLQEDMARIFNVCDSRMIRRYESGETRVPGHLSMLIRLYKLLRNKGIKWPF